MNATLRIDRAGDGFAITPPASAPYHARWFASHREACTYAALMARAYGWQWRDYSGAIERRQLRAFKLLADTSAALLSREECHSAAQAMADSEQPKGGVQ